MSRTIARQRKPPAARTARAVLAVGRGGPELDELTQDLQGRSDLLLVHCPELAAAREALRSVPVALLIVCAAVPERSVTQALRAVDELRPGIPVLVVRARSGAAPARWATRGVGVLRRPLLPHALSRSVEVVLGLVEGRR
jgi:DNA-binding NtrC family response regulator